MKRLKHCFQQDQATAPPFARAPPFDCYSAPPSLLQCNVKDFVRVLQLVVRLMRTMAYLRGRCRFGDAHRYDTVYLPSAYVPEVLRFLAPERVEQGEPKNGASHPDGPAEPCCCADSDGCTLKDARWGTPLHRMPIDWGPYINELKEKHIWLHIRHALFSVLHMRCFRCLGGVACFPG